MLDSRGRCRGGQRTGPTDWPARVANPDCARRGVTRMIPARHKAANYFHACRMGPDEGGGGFIGDEALAVAEEPGPRAVRPSLFVPGGLGTRWVHADQSGPALSGHRSRQVGLPGSQQPFTPGAVDRPLLSSIRHRHRHIPEIDSLHVEIRAWDVSLRVALGADPAGIVPCPVLGVS
jgi:hypothetical protein